MYSAVPAAADKILSLSPTLIKIYQSINQLEKSKINVTSYNRYTDKFLPVLIAALGFLLIEILLRYTVFKKFP
jgi:Ca-activated chloride channel family protein